MMYEEELISTMDQFLQAGKGILAADESNNTIGKRFANIGVENTVENRRKYRQLLATTPNLGDYINGVILFEETFTQQDENGVSLAELFIQQGIMPGIKVDKGLVNLPNTQNEQVTQGLDGLEERLLHFKQLGARFAKWRNVYTINATSPSIAAIRTGSDILARYAATCQAVGIVPIVEPELLMDGMHSIIDCAEAYDAILHDLFHALFVHQVDLECMVLKPSMVTSGAGLSVIDAPDDVADYTLNLFRHNIPAAVPFITFLSGGQTPDQATINLNAINSAEHQPWTLSFSFGRALQEECLKAWGGQDAYIQQAQEKLLQRAQALNLACFGEYGE